MEISKNIANIALIELYKDIYISYMNIFSIVVAPVPGVITGYINDGSRLIELIAVVSGGTPAADTFSWTLPDGTELLPGQTTGSYVASQPTVSC